MEVKTENRDGENERGGDRAVGKIARADGADVPSGQILASKPDSVGGTESGGTAEPIVPVDWQTAMKRAIRDGGELRRRLRLPRLDTPTKKFRQIDAEAGFPTFVPLELLDRIRPGDPNDPILRQVAPDVREGDVVAGFDDDPVGDRDAIAAGSLLHKYEGRALMIATSACGVHCRYCFRREFPYHQGGDRQSRHDAAIEHLRTDESVDEVLLSGGDPLTMTDHQLSELIGRIESIGHVRRLRIHTRMPVVIPQRMTDRLIGRLRSSRLAVWVVIHANHSAEIDQSVAAALGRTVDAGIPVLNQAVLLRGVNDDADSLEALCRRLIDLRVVPYYLHQLDRVRGASHFDVPTDVGLAIMDQLRQRLPGYALPRYVVERAGERSKTEVASMDANG